MRASLEQRLFVRILGLTFLLGITVGIWWTLTGMRVYNSLQPSSPLSAIFSFDGPLSSLQIIVSGAALALYSKIMKFGSPSFTFPWRTNGNGTFLHLIGYMNHFLGVMGVCSMGIGFLLLIWMLLRLPNPELSSPQQFVWILFLSLIVLGIGWISFYQYRRGSHRVAQREREEKSQRKDPTL